MAREIVTHVWCDYCMEEDDTRSPATELAPITIMVGNRVIFKPRMLALCDKHEQDFNANYYEPLKDYLTTFGQIPEGETVVGSEENKRRVRCPIPDCDSRPFKHTASMRSHVRRHHNLTMGQVEDKYGADALPKSNPVDEEREPYTLECGERDCDVSYTYPDYRRPEQALAVHKARTHGIAGAKKQKKHGKDKDRSVQEELSA